MADPECMADDDLASAAWAIGVRGEGVSLVGRHACDAKKSARAPARIADAAVLKISMTGTLTTIAGTPVFGVSHWRGYIRTADQPLWRGRGRRR